MKIRDSIIFMITAGVLILLLVVIVGDYIVALEENRPPHESVITLMKMSTSPLKIPSKVWTMVDYSSLRV